MTAMIDVDRPHPAFGGNPDDLRELMKLAASRIRSREREAATAAWDEFKRGRQLAVARSQRPTGKGQAMTKGGYVRATTGSQRIGSHMRGAPKNRGAR